MGKVYRFFVFAVMVAGMLSVSLAAQTPPPGGQDTETGSGAPDQPAPAGQSGPSDQAGTATRSGPDSSSGGNPAGAGLPSGQEFLTPGLGDAMAVAHLAGPEAQFSPPLLDLLSREAQARAYVQSIYHRSFVLGGLGYLGQEEYGLGALFGGLDLAIIAGTLLGAHALLPNQVQVQNLDYFATPCKDLETAWSSLSLADLLPALAVLAGGSAARMAMLSLEADGARKSAAKKIREGTITFSPRPWMLLDSKGSLYLGMRLSGPGW